MPKRKKQEPITAQIVPASAPAPLLSRVNVQALIERAVQARVDEILGRRSADLLEPDFQPKEVSLAIQARQTVFERRKWTMYFVKWGCRTCGRKANQVSHATNGLCDRCRTLTWDRLHQLRKDFERAHPTQEIDKAIDRLTSRVRTAQALLGEGEK